mgnify:CR=1 FL=1
MPLLKGLQLKANTAGGIRFEMTMNKNDAIDREDLCLLMLIYC